MWHRVDKSKSSPPKSGTYSDWKPLLADEANHQCVYCAIRESSFGGLRNFHVEHYRPKKKFPALINEFSNLFFACAICNTFKGDDWPRDPESNHGVPSYPNPAEIHYSELFQIDRRFGRVTGQFVAAVYIEERLYLNRPQLIAERRTEFLYQKIQELENRIERLAGEPGVSADFLRELLGIRRDISAVYKSQKNAIPYKDAEVKKLKK